MKENSLCMPGCKKIRPHRTRSQKAFYPHTEKLISLFIERTEAPQQMIPYDSCIFNRRHQAEPRKII